MEGPTIHYSPETEHGSAALTTTCLAFFHLAVRASPHRVRQPERKLHDCGDTREGRERQSACLRTTDLQNADHRGRRQDPA